MILLIYIVLEQWKLTSIVLHRQMYGINSDVVVKNGIYSTLNDLQSSIGRASCCLC